MMVGESNEPWLGKVPSKWAIRRIKDIVELKCGDGITSESITPVGDFPVYGGNGLRGYTTSFTHEGHYVLIGRQGALCGNINYAKGKFWASEHAVVASMIGKIDTYWLGELLRDMNLNQYSNAAAQPGLAVDRIKFLRMPVPPLEEQQRIAAYLDASCAAIDAAVAAKRRQLETLDALRKSTIKRAVMMGLNPSVQTQRTDVEWIPEIPQHWRLVRVKDVMEFFNTVRVPLSAAERGVMTERTYDYYGASGVIDKVEDYHFEGTYILIAEDGANLITRSKPLAFLATGKFWVNNHAHILKPRRGGDDTFFVTLLESQDFSLFVTGAAQPKLTMENLGRFKLAVPRLAEQKAIAAFIREKDAEFRPLFAQIERQIDTLVNYRKSLIHECVTGQRRITENDTSNLMLT